MTRHLAKTSGQVLLRNKDIADCDNFDEVGVCPQNDCLWPQLTPREHLELFARIKGLDNEEMDAIV